MAEHMNCERCGVLCEKTGRAQKYCPACRKIKEKEWRRSGDARRRERERQERLACNAKIEKSGTEARPKRERDSRICKLWKTCRYGINHNYGSGACNYSSITGHCKIAIRTDGTRTVAPVANCPYYHPKEAKK